MDLSVNDRPDFRLFQKGYLPDVARQLTCAMMIEISPG
jgi:hypothetical protein